MFEQSIVFHKAVVRNIYNVYYFKTLSICIFNTVKMQSGIGFIVDAYLHTYVYNSPLQRFSQDCVIASHTTYVGCVNFNVEYERKIFEKLIHGRFIYYQSFCQRPARNGFHISFLMTDLGYEPRLSRLIS